LGEPSSKRDNPPRRDNSNDEELTLRALRKATFSRTTSSSPATAPKRSISSSAPADTAERDPAQMPACGHARPQASQAGGFDVLKLMRADPRTKAIPVVVLTSSSEDEDMVRSYELGANSYVRKPVEFSAFAHAVGQLGIYWCSSIRGRPG